MITSPPSYWCGPLCYRAPSPAPPRFRGFVMLITGHLVKGRLLTGHNAEEGAHFTCADTAASPPGSPVITALVLLGEATPEESP